MKKLVDLYPYRLSDDHPEYLLLKRAEDVSYAGQWRMVAGKVKENEKSWQAAVRELQEETSLAPEDFWVIPSLNRFFDPIEDTIHFIPAFAAEMKENSNPILNYEHDEYRWTTISEANELIHWPEQLRLFNLLHSILTSGSIIPDWKIDIK